jgi:16S rRNA (cytosine1402-N4)-methyltransferase
MTAPAHIPVLLNEAVVGLAVQPNGIYLDGTFGRGGHSSEVLAALGEAGRLFAIDQDLTAIDVAQQRFADEQRFAIAHSSFAELPALCECWGITGKVDGVLLDIGVSSPQLDDAERGFSFMNNGPLDMRMNQSAGMSAAEWVATADAEEMANVIYQYGEEKNSRRIARRIVERREERAITTTKQLADIVASASRARDRKKHPATRTFQAIRIHINKELEVLETALQASLGALRPGGRLAVISFHSLEDRIVKNFMREQAQGKPNKANIAAPRGLPVQQEVQVPLRFKLIGKAIKPSEEELLRNPRSRSSVLRIAEKLA